MTKVMPYKSPLRYPWKQKWNPPPAIIQGRSECGQSSYDVTGIGFSGMPSRDSFQPAAHQLRRGTIVLIKSIGICPLLFNSKNIDDSVCKALMEADLKNQHCLLDYDFWCQWIKHFLTQVSPLHTLSIARMRKVAGGMGLHVKRAYRGLLHKFCI